MALELANEPNSVVVNQWLAACARQMEHRKNFATGGIEAAHRHIFDMTGGRCVFSVTDPGKFIDFGAGGVNLGDTSIRFIRWDSTTDCQKITHRPPNRHRVIVHYLLRGEFDAQQGNQSVHVRAGQVLVVGASGSTIKRWHGACELLTVSIARTALARMLASDLNIDDAIPFEGLNIVKLSDVATLAHFIATVVTDLNEPSSVFDEPDLAFQVERTLHLLLLKSLLRQNVSYVSDGSSTIAPFYVRRAEVYLRDNLDADVTIEALAVASGVSARTLHYGFKVYRNVSPMKYLKKARLTTARSALLEASVSGRRVGDIAVSCGYTSFSHFSRDYKEMFGESPSSTTRRQ
jgi:AraC-like DNA-binding protein